MTLIDGLILAVSSFFNVFLLGFQSKNVHQSRYVLAFFTSIAICAAQMVFVKVAMTGAWLTFLAVSGLSGALGIVTAIFVHDLISGRIKLFHREHD